MKHVDILSTEIASENLLTVLWAQPGVGWPFLPSITGSPSLSIFYLHD